MQSKQKRGKCKIVFIDLHIPKKPKRVSWAKKHCVLCKKHGSPHKTHNTLDYFCFNKNDTPIKRSGGSARPQPKEKQRDGAKFAQII